VTVSTAVVEPLAEAPPAPPEPSAKELARASSSALKRLRAPVMGRTRIAIVLAALGALAALVPFVALARLAELLLVPGPVDRGEVVTVVWLVVAGLGARGLLSGVALVITHLADTSLQAHLRRRMIDRLGRVPLGWFSDTSSGMVRKSAQDDVDDLHHLVAHHSVELTGAVVLPVGGLAYLVWLDWRLALLAVATLPVYGAAYAVMMRGYQDRIAHMNVAFGRISAAVAEFVGGIAVVKAFGRARRAHEAYRRTAAEFGETYAGWVGPMLRLSSLSSMALVGPVIAVVNLAGGTWFVAAGWVSPVEAMTGLLVALILPSTITALGFGAQSRRTAAAAALRVQTLLDTPPLPVPASPSSPDGHRVEFSDVRFSYDGRSDVLRDVTFTMEPGTVTALVGPSGSGKSTLATLLPRFHDVTAGAIRLGGVDVRDVAPEELYRHVGFVLQDVQLLRMSLLDNIRLGRPSASDSDVHAAAVAAQIDARIRALPRGYDSVVGEDAVLSGGEAQRVSIARALLADAPVLVLDEATAFADPESEAAIQDALSELAGGRTLLVIAHRLSTITGADRIVVLDDGRVAESGTHERLLAAGGRYARMWEAAR
jgi:ATP-binding cassette, subfamily B, bacterial IrtA/YbtP